MAEPTEDVPYSVSSPAASKEQSSVDVDQPNKSILIELLKEIKSDIENQRSFDSLTLPQNATPDQKIAAFDEMAIHKGVASHLEKYKIIVENKIRELK